MFLPTRLPPLPLHLENFGQQNTTTVASATLTQSMQPFSHMVSQNMISNLAATGTSSQEQQMALLQGMNQSQLGVPNQQFPQQNPYPNRWFRMSLGDSQQSPLDPFALPVASTMPDAAACATIRQSTMPPMSFLANHQPLMNPLLTTSFSSNSHAADDDPFEPVPLLEDISRRHSQGK